jgi:hypothetical protein
MTMARKSNSLTYLRRALWRRYRAEKDPKRKQDYRHLHETSMEAEEEVTDIVRDAEMQGIRNPAFPDDLVGWLDDDFDPPDDRKPKKDEDEE